MYYFEGSKFCERPSLASKGKELTFLWVDFRKTSVELDLIKGAKFMGCIFDERFFLSKKMDDCSFTLCLWITDSFPPHHEVQVKGAKCEACNFDVMEDTSIALKVATQQHLQIMLEHIRPHETDFKDPDAVQNVFRLVDGEGHIFLPLLFPLFLSDDFAVARNSFAIGFQHLQKHLNPKSGLGLAAGVALLYLMVPQHNTIPATELFLSLQTSDSEAKRVLDDCIQFVFQSPWPQPSNKKSWALQLAHHLALHSPAHIALFPISEWLSELDSISHTDWDSLYKILLACNAHWGLDDESHTNFKHTIAPAIEYLISSPEEQKVRKGLQLIDRTGLPTTITLAFLKALTSSQPSPDLTNLLNWVIFQFDPDHSSKRMILRSGLLKSPYLDIFKRNSIYWEDVDGNQLFSDAEIIEDLADDNSIHVDHGLVWADILGKPVFHAYVKRIANSGHSPQSNFARDILHKSKQIGRPSIG